MAARVFALAHPDRTSGFISVDGAVLFPPAEPEALEKWSREYQGFAATLTGADQEAKTRQFIESMFVPATPEAARREILSKILSTPTFVRNSAMKHMGDPEIWRRGPGPGSDPGHIRHQ